MRFEITQKVIKMDILVSFRFGKGFTKTLDARLDMTLQQLKVSLTKTLLRKDCTEARAMHVVLLKDNARLEDNQKRLMDYKIKSKTLLDVEIHEKISTLEKSTWVVMEADATYSCKAFVRVVVVLAAKR